MEIREVLALNLRKFRQAQGLSQLELAHRAEIDRTYVSALERSVYAAGIDVVDRLARVLGGGVRSAQTAAAGESEEGERRQTSVR
jgi:transcriptional regulator with XRE-family HTH domain